MTRTKHYSHPTPAFPVYCLGWADDTTLLLGGGGGASRTGVLNKIKHCRVSSDGSKLTQEAEQQFEPGEDAPNSMAVDREQKIVVTGVNAAESSIKANPFGGNVHVRTFGYGGGSFETLGGVQTITDEWKGQDEYPYQKITVLNHTSTLLAIGTTNNRVSIVTFPNLERLGEDIVIDENQGELVSVDWSVDGGWLAVTSEKAIKLFSISLPISSAEKSSSSSSSSSTASSHRHHPTWHFRQTIFPPSLDIAPVTFKSARFSRLPSTTLKHLMIHTILNSNPPKKVSGRKQGKGSGGFSAKAQKKAFACNFALVKPKEAKNSVSEGTTEKKDDGFDGGELGKWDIVARRELGTKPVTVMDVSADGLLIAYAFSDYSLVILDSLTLAPLLKILHAHSFAITDLAFNPSATLLASAGADNTVRVVVVPDNFGGSAAWTVLGMILAAILALVVWYIQKHGGLIH